MEVAQQLLVDYLAEGIRIEWSFGGLSEFPDDDAIQRYMRDLGNVVASVNHPQPVMMAQINEGVATMPDPRTPGHAYTLMREFFERAPHVIRGLTFPYDEGEQALQAWKLDIVPMHVLRDYGVLRGWNSIRHTLGTNYNDGHSYPYGVPVHHSEPGGAGTSVDNVDNVRWGYSRQVMTRILCVQAAAAIIGSGTWTYMTAPGIRWRPDSWDTDPASTINRGKIDDCPGFIEVSRLIHTLPSDTGQWSELYHGGRAEAWVSSPDLNGSVKRIDQNSSGDGRGLALCYGVSGTYRPELKRAVSEVRYRDPVTAEVVWSGDRPPAIDREIIIEAEW